MTKPFRTTEEMVQILESRGLTINEQTAYFLRSENYYSVINGYKDIFLAGNTHPEKYAPGTTFDELYSVFLFDRALRYFTFQWLMTIESMLKTVIAHKSSEYYQDDPEFYLKLDTFKTDKRTIRLSRKTVEKLQQQHDRKHPSLDHYRRQYGYIPFWVLVSYVTFGELSHFYAHLRERSLQQKIVNELNALLPDNPKKLTVERLRAYLRVLSDFRNVCAHNERFYCHYHSRVSVNGKNLANVADLLNIISQLLLSEDIQHFHRRFVETYSTFLKSGAVRPEYMDKIILAMGMPSDMTATSIFNNQSQGKK